MSQTEENRLRVEETFITVEHSIIYCRKGELRQIDLMEAAKLDENAIKTI